MVNIYINKIVSKGSNSRNHVYYCLDYYNFNVEQNAVILKP